MAALEQEILEKLARLDEDQKRRVLEFVSRLETPSQQTYTARKLLGLPLAERERLVAEAQM